jgi:hypothetical protein
MKSMSGANWPRRRVPRIPTHTMPTANETSRCTTRGRTKNLLVCFSLFCPILFLVACSSDGLEDESEGQTESGLGSNIAKGNQCHPPWSTWNPTGQEDCAAGLACRWDHFADDRSRGTTWVCTDRKDYGERCEEDDDCIHPHKCDWNRGIGRCRRWASSSGGSSSGGSSSGGSSSQGTCSGGYDMGTRWCCCPSGYHCKASDQYRCHPN